MLRKNGKYINSIKAYLETSTLPATVINRFKKQLEEKPLNLPAGYEIKFAGEEEKRTTAESSLYSLIPLFTCLILFLMVFIFRSFRAAVCIGLIGILTLGIVPLMLVVFSYPFGFMSLVGAMGLVGIAINDSIVILAGLNQLPAEERRQPKRVAQVVFGNTRHILTTTLTTMAGFFPLIVSGGEFWPPMAIAICGGMAGATLLALFFLPSLFIALHSRAIGPLAGMSGRLETKR